MRCLMVGMQTMVAVVGDTINEGVIHNGQTHIAVKGAGVPKAEDEVETVEIEVEVKEEGVKTVGTGGKIDTAVEIVKGTVGIKVGLIAITVLVMTGHITHSCSRRYHSDSRHGRHRETPQQEYRKSQDGVSKSGSWWS